MERAAGTGGPVVAGLGPAGFRVDDVTHRAVLLTTERALAWMPPPLDTLTGADIAPLLDPAPEFVLIGTGATLIRPPAGFVAALEAAGMGVEAMDSRAAARAWGVLRGEGRRIAAVLYPLG